MADTPSVSELTRVHFDNVRDHQIGGETDGITPNVAADIGFVPLSELVIKKPEIPADDSEGIKSTLAVTDGVSGVIPQDVRKILDQHHKQAAINREAAPQRVLPSDYGATVAYVNGRGGPHHS